MDAEKDVRTVRVGFGLLRVYATETPSRRPRRQRIVVGYDGEIFRRVRARGVESWTIDARGARGNVRGVRGDGRYRDDARGVDVDVASMVAATGRDPRGTRARRTLASANDAESRTSKRENVRVLTSMGFDEAAARRALQRANDDVQRAATSCSPDDGLRRMDRPRSTA